MPHGPSSTDYFPLSLHDALPISLGFMQQIPDERFLLQEEELVDRLAVLLAGRAAEQIVFGQVSTGASNEDRKSTRLNSSHVAISYAVFSLKKKKHTAHPDHITTH